MYTFERLAHRRVRSSWVLAPFVCLLGAALLAIVQAHAATVPDAKSTTVAAGASGKADAKPIEDLRLAAQRLRDAVHQMAREPAGAKRAELIREADRTLTEVENAMVNLPPDLLTAQATESHYKAASDQLVKATENLHEAVQALAKDPNSKRRNETMKKIDTALSETHRLMHEMPRGAAAAGNQG